MKNIGALFSQQFPQLEHAGQALQAKAQSPDPGVLKTLEPEPLHRLIRFAVKYAR